MLKAGAEGAISGREAVSEKWGHKNQLRKAQTGAEWDGSESAQYRDAHQRCEIRPYHGIGSWKGRKGTKGTKEILRWPGGEMKTMGRKGRMKYYNGRGADRNRGSRALAPPGEEGSRLRRWGRPNRCS
jgi:hypothetical protein